MATNNDRRFGLHASVEEHMAVLKVLSKNDNDAITRFWKSNAQGASSQKAMLFNTLAMLDPTRLHGWIASTPVNWWSLTANKNPNQANLDKDYRLSSSVASKYDMIAGGMLNYVHLNNHSVFMDLLVKSPHIFQTSSCRHFMHKWCESLPEKDLTVFQPLLVEQPSSWYVTNPQRVLMLTEPPTAKTQELMMSAALAKDGVTHPLLEARYPGFNGCVHVMHGMLSDTKQKKAYLRQWLTTFKEDHPGVDSLTLPTDLF